MKQPNHRSALLPSSRPSTMALIKSEKNRKKNEAPSRKRVVRLFRSLQLPESAGANGRVLEQLRESSGLRFRFHLLQRIKRDITERGTRATSAFITHPCRTLFVHKVKRPRRDSCELLHAVSQQQGEIKPRDIRGWSGRRRFGGYPAADCIIPIVSSAVFNRGTDSEADQRERFVGRPCLVMDERDSAHVYNYPLEVNDS